MPHTDVTEILAADLCRAYPVYSAKFLYVLSLCLLSWKTMTGVKCQQMSHFKKKIKQDRQCTYNATLGLIHATIVAVENQ